MLCPLPTRRWPSGKSVDGPPTTSALADVNSAGAAPGGGGGKKGRFGFGKGKGAVGADVGMVPLSSDAPAEGTDPALAAGGVDALDPNAINLAAVEQQQVRGCPAG